MLRSFHNDRITWITENYIDENFLTGSFYKVNPENNDFGLSKQNTFNSFKDF